MKTVSKLSLLALTILMVGCNEKISPELQQANSTTPTTVTPTAPTEYYFGIENSSSVLLNFKLHKTGPGNGLTKCEIRSTTELSNDIFRGNQNANDITCFFEAEELALFHGGFSFDIKASKNTCDYVAYTPFGFYDRRPGDSSGIYHQVSCKSETTQASHVAQAATNLGLDLRDRNNTVIGCNEWIIDDSQIPQAVREKFTVRSDQELCFFNHTRRGGPNCDVGEITINELQVTYTPATATEPAILKEEVVERTVNCGGTIAACVAGPTKIMREGATYFTEVSNSIPDTEFKKNYSYDGLLGKRQSVKAYANYRRNLASKHIDYVTADALPAAYTSIWADPSGSGIGRIFDPQVMDFFSHNLMMDDDTDIVTEAMIEAEAIKTNKYYAMPLAADPFMGLASPINPFYTFYCLDTAMDIKARIRMVVREWDRIFPTCTASPCNLELLSDLFLGSSARQDNPLRYSLSGTVIGGVEVGNERDYFMYYNDLKDWDDLVPMRRSGGAWSPTGTIWAPVPVTGFPDGWFNPEYFTNGNY